VIYQDHCHTQTLVNPEQPRHFKRSRQRRTSYAAYLVGALTFTYTALTSAAEAPKNSPLGKPQTVAVDSKRLGKELDLFAEGAKRARLATALAGLGIGGALVPSGFVLLSRTDGVARSLVIGMLIGGSAQIASAPLMLIPSRMDELRDTFRSRYAGFDSKGTVREFENEWRSAAEASRSKRRYVGTTLLGLGATNLVLGLTSLLAPPILGMSRKTQYTVGGVMMGVGVSTTTIGLHFLLEWSTEETSWEAYRTMKSDASELKQPRSPTVVVVPMSGGALALTTLPF
jgi:hypothetical protein